MLSDQPQATPPLASPSREESVRSKVRIRFRKEGNLRLVSHHDLMTCFERMLRRAALPFRSSQGFHPKPRLVFALSLALGIVGLDEAVELELEDLVSAEDVHSRLAQQAPPGLVILSVRCINPRMGAQVRSVTYRLALPPERLTELPPRIDAVLAAAEWWTERTRPHKRRFNLRPFLRGLRLADGGLEIDLWVTPTGMARPDEVLALLDLRDLLEGGAVLERTCVEIADENPTPGDSLPTLEGGGSEREAKVHDRAALTPLIPGPMNFDS